MTFIWLLYILINVNVINKQSTSNFKEYYNSLNQTQKDNLHILGEQHPDELFLLNMLFDR